MNLSKRVSWTFALVLSCSYSGVAIGQQTVKFSPQDSTGRANQVTIQLDVRGEMRVNPDGRAVKVIPMMVSGRLNYSERRLIGSRTDNSQAIQTVRHYQLARADIQIGQGRTSNLLKPGAGLIVVNCKEAKATQGNGSKHDGIDRVEFHRIGEAVTSDEVDLINIPGNTALVNDLLNTQGVTRIGQTWQVDSELLASFLTVEAISKSDVKLKLTRFTDKSAIILMVGKINGAVSGVATEIDVNGVMTYDLEEKQITKLDLTLQEDRSIGHAEPGFRVTAKLMIEIHATALPKELSDDRLAASNLSGLKVSPLRKFYSQAGGFSFMHDDRWKIMHDGGSSTILRMVDQGDLVAQCNISALQPLTNGKPLSLEKFRYEISQAISESQGKLIAANEFDNQAGLHILAVQSAGIVSELSINWYYYHISDAKGNRVALAYTLESKFIERFAGANHTIATSFRLHKRPTPKLADPKANPEKKSDKVDAEVAASPKKGSAKGTVKK